MAHFRGSWRRKRAHRPSYVHLSAEVLGGVRWGILEDLFQLIHVPEPREGSLKGLWPGPEEKGRDHSANRSLQSGETCV